MAAFFLGWLAPSPATAHADSLEDSAPAVWALSGYELALTAGVVSGLVASPCESFGCVEYGLGWGAIGLGVGALSAGVAAGLDGGAHGPFAHHHFSTGLGSGFAAGLAVARALGLGFPAALLVGLGVGATTGAAMLSYAIVRGDELVASEAASLPVHLMTFGPFFLGHLTLALMFAEEGFGFDLLIIAQAIPLLIYAVTIPWAEAELEEEPGSATMPLRAEPSTVPLIQFGLPF